MVCILLMKLQQIDIPECKIFMRLSNLLTLILKTNQINILFYGTRCLTPHSLKCQLPISLLVFDFKLLHTLGGKEKKLLISVRFVLSQFEFQLSSH